MIAIRRLPTPTTSSFTRFTNPRNPGPTTQLLFLSSSSSSTPNPTTTKPNRPKPPHQNHSSSSPPLSMAGILFFGSLCVSTFGLGCWQSSRYFDKIQLIQRRDEELAMDPIELQSNASSHDWETTKRQSNHRRLHVTGTFHHDKEVLMGPRGPPPGAISQSGPNSGRSSGGMASSPQGYFIITPLERPHNLGTVLVNRGWVPLQYVKQNVAWERPTGEVQVVAVASKMEEPTLFSPPHNLSRDVNRFLWLDRPSIEQATKTKGLSPPLIIQTNDTKDDNDTMTFPIQPNAMTVGEFKVTPPVHAGYAATWFGLSGAGILMTRKLITRGR